MDYEDLKKCWKMENGFTDYLKEKFDPRANSIWEFNYKCNDELETGEMTKEDIITPLFDYLNEIRDKSIGVICVFGFKMDLSLSGVFIWRGKGKLFDLLPKFARDKCGEFKWNELNIEEEETRTKIKDYFESYPNRFMDNESRPFMVRHTFL